MSELRMEKLSMESVDITQENIEKIKELFPNVVTEGKIDFDQLKLILGEQIEARNERYQFTWNGKSDSIRFAQRPSTGTLRPDMESSKNWDTTENLYIEGDNLEVLKLLQKSYHNKIKMIYIDPPYNTGGDFVYKDDFKDSIRNYKEQTNQTQRANPETNGRYHTDWLNMMYSRLMLAKNLLTEDGVIFISIDEVEMHNLRKVSDEVFGEINHIADLVWKNKNGGGNDSKHIAVEHEYILMYAKQVIELHDLFIPYDKKYLKRYKDEDNIGKYYWDTFKRKSGKQYYSITCPDGSVLEKDEYGNPISWLRSESRFYNDLKEGEVRIIKYNDKWSVQFKQRLPEGKKPRSVFLYESIFDNHGTTSTGSSENLDLFKFNAFNNPKPINLIKQLLNFNFGKNDIILDFFSGSSTTAHAVMQLNAEDGGNRKFIMVQLPEKTDEKSEIYQAGYENICEIGKERIRRAGEKIKNELIEKRNKHGMLEDAVDPEQLDIGFKVFKLDTSNLKKFDSSSKDLDNFFSEDIYLADRSSFDILYEILLKYGVFDKPVNVINVNSKEAFSIALGQTIVFINQIITEEDVLEIVKISPREVIFDERGFNNDNDKINALKRLETAGVEKVATI